MSSARRVTQAPVGKDFQRVADESPVPVLLYNIPKYAHLTLAPELVAELAQHRNVIGMKDSSGDMALFAKYMAHQSPDFTVITGNGASWAQAFAATPRFVPGATDARA